MTAKLSNRVPSWGSRLRFLLGGISSFRRNAEPLWRNQRATSPFRLSRLGFRPAGIDFSGKKLGELVEAVGEEIKRSGISMPPPLRFP